MSLSLSEGTMRRCMSLCLLQILMSPCRSLLTYYNMYGNINLSYKINGINWISRRNCLPLNYWMVRGMLGSYNYRRVDTSTVILASLRVTKYSSGDSVFLPSFYSLSPPSPSASFIRCILSPLSFVNLHYPAFHPCINGLRMNKKLAVRLV